MSGHPATIIVVEDDREIRRFLRIALEGAGHQVWEAETGSQGLIAAETRKPDLVLLDLGLPDMDGTELVKRLRGWSTVPIIILSARQQESEKVAALDLGADDYLTKPFGTDELLARLRVALRHRGRPPGGEPGPFTVGGLCVDMERRRVSVDGTEVHLTPIEFRLLAELAANPGKVLTHQVLLKAVWGPGHVERPHYLHIYMGHLRHKLEREPARPRYLLTETGVGYRLAAE
jgi:two-component system KDP operon response regulator KdpE